MKGTVVVTGAAGRVGVKIVQAFLEAGYSVQALVHSKLPAEHPLVRANVAVTCMDLATLPEQNLCSWLKAIQPTVLIHSAALSDVAECERQPLRASLINAQVTRMLARACALYQVHFIMLSTEHVFGGTPHPQILCAEEDPVCPLNAYGQSKVQGELATQEECRNKTVWTICRLSVVYGLTFEPVLWPRPDFMQWICTTLQRKERPRVVMDQVNSPLYVVDLTRILLASVGRQLQGIYHVAGSTPLSRYHFALLVARMYGFDEAFIQPVLTSELALGSQRPLNVGLSIEKICHASGIYPRSPEEGLASYRFSG